MKKIIMAFLLLAIIIASACSKTQPAQEPTSQEIQSNDAAPDSIDSGINSANSDDQELSSSQFDDADSGLDDIENM